MSFIPLILVIIGSIFEIIDGTLNLLSEALFKDGIVPNSISLPSLSIQVSLFLLAIIFSIINILMNKSNSIVHFFTTVVAMSLFLGRLSWLIDNIKWAYFS